MSIIESSFSFSSLTIGRISASQDAAGELGNFDALLASFDRSSVTRTESHPLTSLLDPSNVYDYIDEMLAHIQRMRGDDARTEAPQTLSKYPFSGLFESTFGLRGPLPEFITMTTARLGLSMEQNLSLQNIAINNKDVVKTPETVQAIAAELRAAGIYG